MALNFPRHVKIVEVGPRDGLQNERELIPTEVKLAFIRDLVAAGLRHIETTSFVHPKWVPQLADAADVVAGLPDDTDAEFSVLVPNMKGLERAIECGIKRIAVFTAASETFARKNINMTIAESLVAFAQVADRAIDSGMTVRGYVSTCFVCPYEGDVDPSEVVRIARELVAMGIDEVSLGDTIGAATPVDVEKTVSDVLNELPVGRVALHFHDTYGTALANVVAGLQLGITTFDASAGGLGGCPYAPGASGNLATEDLVYLLDRMGVASGVNLANLAKASKCMQDHLGRPLPSRNLQRILGAGEE